MSKPVHELIAQELHRQYRAAEKALRCTDVTGERPYLQHDHGWEHCHRQEYFHKRSALMIKRTHVENPETLGEAEQILAATVLLRRLSVEGKLVVPVPTAYADGGFITAEEVRRCAFMSGCCSVPSWEALAPFPDPRGRGNGKTNLTLAIILAALEPTDADLKAKRDRAVREALWGKR